MNTKHATVVTCFYPIRSKFPVEVYLGWAREFMKLAAPIVLFTTPELKDAFKAMRGTRPLHVIDRPFHEIDTWIAYEKEWCAAHTKDPEQNIHSPELYAIWACKPFFVREAIDINPFRTTKFFWCDIGVFRQPGTSHIILDHFPRGDWLPDGKILLNAIAPLEEADRTVQSDGIPGDFLHVNRLVGGLWGGDERGCRRWLAAYESMLVRYFVAGRFAGKDQSVMLSALIDKPSLAIVVRSTSAGDPWFHLTRHLSDPTVEHSLDPSYIRFKIDDTRPVVSVKLQGGIGNQYFQISAAYAHTMRSTGLHFKLEKYKRNVKTDGRSTYWESLLYRFYHVLEKEEIDTSAMIVYNDVNSIKHTPIDPVSEKGMWIQGFFQTGKYFSDMRPLITYLMKPPAWSVRYVRNKYADLLVKKDRLVAVHSRQTDYCASHWNKQFHGPLPPSYYKNAMDRMSAHVKDPIYLLCGDDPLYWITHMAEFPHLAAHEFHIMTDETDINTIALLTQINYFIMANSTFSWWAVYLADQAKHVIAPSDWFGPKGPTDCDDVYFADWERVGKN